MRHSLLAHSQPNHLWNEGARLSHWFSVPIKLLPFIIWCPPFDPSYVATETRETKDKNYLHEFYCYVVRKHALKNAKLYELTLNNPQLLREMGVEKKNYSSYSFKKSMIMDPSWKYWWNIMVDLWSCWLLLSYNWMWN